MKINYDYKNKNGRNLFIKIIISAVILISAVCINRFFPKRNSKYDYVSAFKTIEAGLSGEMDLTDAINGFYESAFVANSSDRMEI